MVRITRNNEYYSFDVFKGENLQIHLDTVPEYVCFDYGAYVLSITTDLISYGYVDDDFNESTVSYHREHGLYEWSTEEDMGIGSVLEAITEEEQFQDMVNENAYGMMHDMQNYLLQVKDKL